MTAVVSSLFLPSKQNEVDALQHVYAPSRMRRARPRPCSFSKTALPCLTLSSGPIRPKEFTAAVNGELRVFRLSSEFLQLTFDSTL
jgi:hypothetical protein